MIGCTTNRSARRPLATLAGAFVVIIALAVPASETIAADFQEYLRLSAEGTRLLDLLREYQGDVPESLRLEAIEADRAIIDWLDLFFEDPAFAELPEDQQAAAHSDQNSWVQNLAVQFVALGQCQDASDLLLDLATAPHVDDALAELIAGLNAEAEECIANQNEVATVIPPVRVSIESDPAGAQVLIDDEPVGTTPYSGELEPGDYQVSLQSDGYETHDLVLSAEEDPLSIGPITLSQRFVPELPGRSIGAREWALWGVGAAGVATGVFTFASARELEGDIDDSPPPGMELTDSGESDTRDTVDTLDMVSYVAGGIGLAAAITGTVLYFLQDDEPTVSEGGVDVTWAVGIRDVSIGLAW